jgi:3-dehydroquinate synthase
MGVKNGINAFNKKNFLGTFAVPYAVFNDFSFLTSLCDRNWRAGIAEAVKVALIKDYEFFDFISTHIHALNRRDMNVMADIIYKCAQLHLNHIATSGDAFETGSSRPLDFGHWAAHKLEQLTEYNLLHGEAVAIGIALDSTYSYLLGFISHWEWQKITNTLMGLGFKLYIHQLSQEVDFPNHSNSIIQGIEEFRTHLGGELNLTLITGIGKGIEVNEVNLDMYKQAIKILENIDSNCI